MGERKEKSEWVCPDCGTQLPSEMLCSGSFLDRSHPPNVRAVRKTEPDPESDPENPSILDIVRVLGEKGMDDDAAWMWLSNQYEQIAAIVGSTEGRRRVYALAVSLRDGGAS